MHETVASTLEATDRQLSYLKALGREITGLVLAAETAEVPGYENMIAMNDDLQDALRRYGIGLLGTLDESSEPVQIFERGNASKAIEYCQRVKMQLKKRIREHDVDAPIEPAAAMPDPAPKPGLEDGMYKLDDAIYKVQHAVHGSGRQYAKRLEISRDSDGEVLGGKFVYAPGAVFKLKLSDRMSLEEAKEFGALYGTCCVCGRTLTDEKSIAAGIGPVCAGKWF